MSEIRYTEDALIRIIIQEIKNNSIEFLKVDKLSFENLNINLQNFKIEYIDYEDEINISYYNRGREGIYESLTLYFIKTDLRLESPNTDIINHNINYKLNLIFTSFYIRLINTNALSNLTGVYQNQLINKSNYASWINSIHLWKLFHKYNLKDLDPSLLNQISIACVNNWFEYKKEIHIKYSQFTKSLQNLISQYEILPKLNSQFEIIEEKKFFHFRNRNDYDNFYFYYEICFQSLYNFWDRIGDILYEIYLSNIPLKDRYFHRLFNKDKNGIRVNESKFDTTSENYKWFINFQDNIYSQIISNDRNDYVHTKSKMSYHLDNYYIDYDFNKIENKINILQNKIDEDFKFLINQQDNCITGIEKCIGLIKEKI